MRAEIDRRAMALLSTVHLATDFANGALPALIPFLKDRFSLSYTLVGVLVLASDAPRYWLVVVFVLVSGVGVAAFHPEASKFAGYVSGRRRASGMAWFSIGGNLGFALGPVVTTLLVHEYGLRGGLLLAVPSLAAGGVALAVTPYLREFVPEAGTIH